MKKIRLIVVAAMFSLGALLYITLSPSISVIDTPPNTVDSTVVEVGDAPPGENNLVAGKKTKAKTKKKMKPV